MARPANVFKTTSLYAVYTPSRPLQNGAFSMLAFSGRFGRARKITWGEMEKGRRRYLRELDVTRDEIQTAVCAQRQWQQSVHSDPRGLGAIIGGPRMWERGRGDADFLEVRVGTGVQHAPDSVLSVTWPDIASDEELEPVTGQALRDFILEQRKIRDIAKVLNLRSAPGFSFVDSTSPLNHPLPDLRPITEPFARIIKISFRLAVVFAPPAWARYHAAVLSALNVIAVAL